MGHWGTDRKLIGHFLTGSRKWFSISVSLQWVDQNLPGSVQTSRRFRFCWVSFRSGSGSAAAPFLAASALNSGCEREIRMYVTRRLRFQHLEARR